MITSEYRLVRRPGTDEMWAVWLVDDRPMLAARWPGGNASEEAVQEAVRAGSSAHRARDAIHVATWLGRTD